MTITGNPILDQGLIAAVVPVITAVAAVLLLSRIRKMTGRFNDALLGVGLVLGFCVGFFALSGFSPFPLKSVYLWLPYLAILVCLVAWAMNPLPAALKFSALALLLLVLIRIHLHPLAATYSPQLYWAWFLALTLIGGVYWYLWRRASNRADGGEMWLLMVVCAVGASLVTVLDGSVVIGQFGGVLAAATGGLFLLWLGDRTFKPGEIVICVFLALWGAVMINAKFYVSVSPISLILVGLAPAAALILSISPKTQWSAWRKMLLVAGTAAILIVIAIIRLVATMEGDSYGY